MKSHLIFALKIALTVTTINATAQTYQWKDSSGRTVISDTPPAGKSQDSLRTIGSSPPPSTTSAPAKPEDAPQTSADKNLAFKKRQQEAAEKAAKDAKEATNAAQKIDTCERAKKQLLVLESGRQVATADDRGERRILDSQEREMEIQRTRGIVSSACN